jgi:hypothetical protein
LKPAAGGDREASFQIAEHKLIDSLRRARVESSAHVLDERSYAEIAREPSCSEAVVRQRVHRGLDHMRERLTAIG